MPPPPMSTHPSGPVPPRYHPMEIAPETWVIQATVGEGVAPQAVHLNAMVIRGAEPVIVDTGCPVFRDQYLEDLFEIVEPDGVRPRAAPRRARRAGAAPARPGRARPHRRRHGGPDGLTPPLDLASTWCHHLVVDLPLRPSPRSTDRPIGIPEPPGALMSAPVPTPSFVPAPRRQRVQQRAVIAAFLAGAVAVAGCSSGTSVDASSSTVPSSVTTGTPVPSTATPGTGARHDHGVIEVEAVDFAFENLPRTIEAGTRLTLSNGATTELHELVAIRLPADDHGLGPNHDLRSRWWPIVAHPGPPTPPTTQRPRLRRWRSSRGRTPRCSGDRRERPAERLATGGGPAGPAPRSIAWPARVARRPSAPGR